MYLSAFIIFLGLLYVGNVISEAIKDLPGWQEYIDPEEGEESESRES